MVTITTTDLADAVLGQARIVLVGLDLLRDILGGVEGHIQGVDLYDSNSKWMDR